MQLAHAAWVALRCWYRQLSSDSMTVSCLVCVSLVSHCTRDVCIEGFSPLQSYICILVEHGVFSHEFVAAGEVSCKKRHAWFVSALQRAAVLTAADAKQRAEIAAAEAKAEAEVRAKEEAERAANEPPAAEGAGGQPDEAADTVMQAPADEAVAGCSHTPSKAGPSNANPEEAEAAPGRAGKGTPKSKATPKKAPPQSSAKKRKHADAWVRSRSELQVTPYAIPYSFRLAESCNELQVTMSTDAVAPRVLRTYFFELSCLGSTRGARCSSTYFERPSTAGL